MIGVYCLTSPSGKSYVGQSHDIEYRLYSYRRGHCKKQGKLFNAFKKYGFDKFQISILEKCDPNELNESERFYINYFDTISNGYNIREGGSNGKMSNETKIKLSILNTGKKMSNECKEKLSVIGTGKKHSEETKNKTSASMMGKKKECSSIKKLSLTKRSRNDGWGTWYNKINKSFSVAFRENGIRFTKVGFQTIELAKEWRDQQLLFQV